MTWFSWSCYKRNKFLPIMRSVYSMYTALFSHGFSLCRSMVCKTYLKNTLINTVSKMAYWKKDKNKSLHEWRHVAEPIQHQLKTDRFLAIWDNVTFCLICCQCFIGLTDMTGVLTIDQKPGFLCCLDNIVHVHCDRPKAKCGSPVCFIGRQKPVWIHDRKKEEFNFPF